MSNMKELLMQGILPKDLKIVDAHAHISEGDVCAAYVRTLPVEKSIQMCKNVGIAAIVASSLKAQWGNLVVGNDRMMEFTKIYPGYVYCNLIFDPHNPEISIRQLEQYHNDPAFIGVKIHPRDMDSCVASNDYDVLYRYCCDHNILVACHTWQTEPQNDPKDFNGVLQRFPELKLQLVHMGGTFRGAMDSIEIANKYPQVLLDINGSLYSQIWIEKLVELAPFEQFVFATDQSFNDPSIMIGRVVMSDLTDEQKYKLLRYNFENAIGKKLVKD